MATQEFIEKLTAQNGLAPSDIWEMNRGGKKIPIITRAGIEKIQAKQGIAMAFEAHVLERNFAVVKATATKGDLRIETFASALCGNGGNSQSNYVVEMAEKRALSRAVLKTVGAYAHGVYGQDESEEFSEEPPPAEAAAAAQSNGKLTKVERAQVAEAAVNRAIELGLKPSEVSRIGGDAVKAMGFNQSSEIPSDKLSVLLQGIKSWKASAEEVPF